MSKKDENYYRKDVFPKWTRFKDADFTLLGCCKVCKRDRSLHCTYNVCTHCVEEIRRTRRDANYDEKLERWRNSERYEHHKEEKRKTYQREKAKNSPWYKSQLAAARRASKMRHEHMKAMKKRYGS